MAKYMPHQKKLFDLQDLCDLYEKYVVKNKKAFMQPQIANQIKLVCWGLNKDFKTLNKNFLSGAITTTGYTTALFEYKKAIDSLENLDHVVLGSAEIIEELRNQLQIA